VSTRERKIGDREALKLAREASTIYASKGKKVVHVDLRREKPDAATLKRLLIGPSGNLRAPTLRVGKTLLVGFDEAVYKKVLIG
jgi:hypothetical protein